MDTVLIIWKIGMKAGFAMALAKIFQLHVKENVTKRTGF
jgi:hypothetical protein